MSALFTSLKDNTFMPDLPIRLRMYYCSIYNRLSKSHYQQWKTNRMRKFYGQFLKPAGLCFDIGANVGRYTSIFLDLENRVVAAEPLLENYNILLEQLNGRKNLTALQLAVSDVTGTSEILKGNYTELSSMDPDFIAFNETQFNCTWTTRQTVQTTTLDDLIRQYGIPDFCKIDVEGFEHNVLCGLSKKIPVISFEFLLPFREKALACIQRVQQLSPNATFNYTLFEFFSLENPEWMNADDFITHLQQLPADHKTGDIICKL